MAINLKESIKGLTFRAILKTLTKLRPSDEFYFDHRGAIMVTDQEVIKRDGSIVKIRGVQAMGGSGGSDSLSIHRPGSGQSIDASRAMDAYKNWVFAAVRAIADEVANIDFRVYQITGDEHEEVREHELIDFLDAVNDFQTGPEFKHMLVSHLELTGNCYIYLEGVKNYNDKPKAMYLLDPGKVKVILDKTRYPYKIMRYEFTIDNKTMSYQPYEIVQLKYPDPSNPYLGIGTVQGIAEWVDNDNHATEFLRQFFIHGAQIGLIFETDMSGEDQLQMLRDSFNEQHAGVHNAWKGIFLPKGVTRPKGGEIQIKDLGMDKIADMSRDKILAGTRVSKTILGTAESDTNRATAETADYVFAKRTIKPKMELICSYLNEFLTPRFGKDIYITFVDAVPEDKAFRTTEMQAAVASKQVITQNEARETFMGLGPLEGGDALDTGASKDAGNPSEADASSAASGNPPKTYKKEKMGYRPARARKGKTQFVRAQELRRDMAKSLSDKIVDILKVKKKKVNEMTNQEYADVVVREKRERVGGHEEKVKTVIRAFNARQKEEVLKNLPKIMKSAKAVAISDLLNPTKWINILVDLMTPLATNIFASEADQALKLIDKPGLDVAGSPEAQAAIADRMALLGRSYNDTVITSLTDKLTEGLSQGYGVGEMGNLVSDIYAWQDQYAAERVARTEANAIAQQAANMAWQQSGVVKEIQWVTLGGDSACEFCQAQDGDIISITDTFYDEGDSIDGINGGTTTANYSDIGGPPLHPMCRCDTRPIVESTDTTTSTSAHKPEETVDDVMAELKKIDNGEI
jgi:HK97 family phage portal protein